MSRRSVLLALSIAVLLAGSVAAVLVVLLHYEPHHHRCSATPPGPKRERCSREFYSEFSELLSALNGKDPWTRRFTDEQINSFLNEGFVQSNLSRSLMPEGISEPRVLFESDRMRLSLRYRSRFISTVVSLKLHVWLPASEPNVVAVCLEQFQAGLVPITAQWLLERISEAVRNGTSNSIEISWYRHDGCPVALLRFQADKPHPTLQLKAIQFEPGAISIHGAPNDNRADAGPLLHTAITLAHR